MRPARGADSSAVLVVPNVKVRVKAQHSTPPSESLRLVAGKLYLYYFLLKLKFDCVSDVFIWRFTT